MKFKWYAERAYGDAIEFGEIYHWLHDIIIETKDYLDISKEIVIFLPNIPECERSKYTDEEINQLTNWGYTIPEYSLSLISTVQDKEKRKISLEEFKELMKNKLSS